MSPIRSVLTSARAMPSLGNTRSDVVSCIRCGVRFTIFISPSFLAVNLPPLPPDTEVAGRVRFSYLSLVRICCICSSFPYSFPAESTPTLPATEVAGRSGGRLVGGLPEVGFLGLIRLVQRASPAFIGGMIRTVAAARLVILCNAEMANHSLTL